MQERIGSIRLRSGRSIGENNPCFVVAEIGNNHQGDVEVAAQMVDEAAKASADAVKFQKRNTEALLTRAGREAPYTGKNSFGPTYGEHRDALELSIEDLAALKARAESLGMVFFASAWDEPSLDQLLSLEPELMKVSSAELVNLPLLRKIGASGIPVILSTGMSTFEDIEAALSELRRYHDDIVLLHCNSRYPCPEEQIGLPVIETMREAYGLPVGYSGHERGMGPSVAAVAFGACVVERHFTLDKTMRGTDHQVSLEPAELAAVVNMIREVEKAVRIKGKKVFPEEQAAAKKLRKSIIFARDLPAGHVIAEADITAKCPGDGVSPVHWDEVLGTTLKSPVQHEEPLRWELLAQRSLEEARAAATS
ncbi:MAG: N-acetylneuraminate synthase family protein [Desulfovibrionaceae bacterium]